MALVSLSYLFPAIAIAHGWTALDPWGEPPDDQATRVVAAYPSLAKAHLARINYASHSGGYYYKGVELYGRHGGEAAFRYLWQESEKPRKLPKGLAMFGLAATGHPDAFPKFRRLLEDPTWQNYAIDAMGWNGAPSSIPILAALLPEEPSPPISAGGPMPTGVHAAYALAKIGPKSLPALHAATRHPHSAVRERAVLAIDLIGDRSSAETLWQIVRAKSKDGAWYRAVPALARLGDVRALEPLLALAEDTGDDEDVAKGLAALGKDPRAWKALRTWAALGTDASPVYARAGGKDLREYWEQGLQGEKARYFAQGLAELRDPRSIPALVSAVKALKGPDTVRFALVAIGKPACSPLRPLLASKDPQVRREAGLILGLLGDAEAIPLLKQLPSEQSWLIEHTIRSVILASVDRSIRPPRAK